MDQSPAPLATPDDREAAVRRLSAAFAEDVLPVEEFERRLSEVYRARTGVALRELTADLPDPSAGQFEAPERSTGPASLPARARDTGLASLPARIGCTLGTVERGGRMRVPGRLVIQARFGNVELDLERAVFEHTVTEVHLDALFANVEVELPEGVVVEDHTRGVLSNVEIERGGRGRGRRRSREPQREADDGARHVVRITGRAIFSNVEVDR